MVYCASEDMPDTHTPRGASCDSQSTASDLGATPQDPAPESAQPFAPAELEIFYADRENFDVLATINGPSPPFSLRALAWYVAVGIQGTDAYNDYERNLSKYTRRRFDPFRRCNRISLELNGDTVVTTVGQMNFFRWLIQSGMWRKLVDNRARIVAEVARRAPRSRTSSRCGSSGGRSGAPGFVHMCGRHVVVFD